jgi:hypothetical protein
MILFDVDFHYSTPKHIVMAGNSVNDQYFLLVITKSKKPFETDFQDECCIVTEHKNIYYKLEITLYDLWLLETRYSKSTQYYPLFRDLRTTFEDAYEYLKNNDYKIKKSKHEDFAYRFYNIPRHVWLIANGLILGEL